MSELVAEYAKRKINENYNTTSVNSSFGILLFQK